MYFSADTPPPPAPSAERPNGNTRTYPGEIVTGDLPMPEPYGIQTSPQIDQISTALSKALPDLHDIPKTAQGYGYKYAALDSVLPIIRKACAKHGLFMLQTPCTGADEIGVATMVTHSSGQWISTSFSVKYESLRNMNGYQSAGSAITYLRRYAALSVFSISGGDNDAAGIEKKEKKEILKTPKKILGPLTRSAGEGAKTLATAFNQLTKEEQAAITPADKAKLKAIARAIH